MQKQLTYTPKQYRASLSTYAKDTVEYQSTNRFITYKVNKNDNDIVVEEINGQFKIYISSKLKTSLIVTTANRKSDYKTKFFALVDIGEHVNINIHWDKKQNILCGFFAAFVLIISLATATLFLAIFFGIISIGYLLYLPRAKKRYRNFIIEFMNTITTS